MSIAAHDLKDPLNRIEGLVSVIKLNDSNLTPDQMDILNIIEDVSRKQHVYVQRILHPIMEETLLSNIDLEKVDIITILEQVCSNYDHVGLSKNIRLFFNAKIKNRFVLGNPLMLEGIFENLISNAFKFSTYYSSINIGVLESFAKLTVAVKDSGPVLSESDKRNVFKKFTPLSARPTAGESSSGLDWQ